MRYIFFIFCVLCFSYGILPAQNRQVIPLEKGWKFTQSDIKQAEKSNFDDQLWENVTVPHDWAIKGPFNELHDAQSVKVTEDGETKKKLRTGRTGSLPWVGVGWYRKAIELPRETSGKRCFVEFDGAMSNAVVYFNGQQIGTWPYGYASFSFELTDYMLPGKKNILAVRLENKEESSRWYPGAGIYRNVRIVLTDPVHVKHWGTYITTPVVDAKESTVDIQTIILNQSGKKQAGILQTVILDPAGKVVAEDRINMSIDKENTCKQQLKISSPLLWDIRHTYLYTAVSNISIDGKTCDEYRTTFGIRSIRFDNEKGFFLNGERVQLNGVCQHHDLGPLGAAINYRALQRQLEILQDMGCNAIRTSHNPPAPELLDLCDQMGFLVIDESFDEWKNPKNKNGYNILWDQWAEKDMVAQIHRDRNHPCVIMWSIGNEIREQEIEGGEFYCRFLTDICHREDPTRPVTAGFNRWEGAIKRGFSEIVDVPGWNYKPQHYRYIHQQFPHWKMYGSETASTISSRGKYYFPVEPKVHHMYEDNQCSSYDMEYPRWATSPDMEFAAQDSFPFIAGEFVWTGFDYLGEPTPYNWPSHSSYFGIIDLGGIPKDRFYLYQSKWTDKGVLHMLPHWTWPERIGKVTPVHVYTSYPSAELFINGKSMGIRKKDMTGPLYHHYRIVWDDVIYQPGEIKVVAFNKNGKKATEIIKKTAGKPEKIRLKADRSRLKADGKDLSFITVSVLDKDGNLCPWAENNIRFEAEGDGFVRGVTNGDPTNIQSLSGNEMKAFSGQCVVVVQSLEKTGKIRLKASAEDLKAEMIELISEN